MAYLTESELLERLEYFTVELEERIIQQGEEDMDSIIKEVPYCISLNDPETFQLLHVNKGHRVLTGFTPEEMLENWEEYMEIVHSDTVKSVMQFLPSFYAHNHPDKTLSFVQYVKLYNLDEFKPVITISKPSRLASGLNLWLTITPQELSQEAGFMTNIVEMDAFKLKNFKRFQQLTTREVEVLKLLANGNNNPQIANKLFISRQTVETHRKNIKRKLALASIRDLMRYAYAFNLVEI